MQSKDTSLPKKKRTPVAKVANVLSYILVSSVLLVFLIFILLQTPIGQKYVKERVEIYLTKKLKSRVEIGKLDMRFPNSVILKDIYIEDQTKDTLISGGQLKVDLNMLQLLTNEIQIKEIKLDNASAKIKRVNADTVFNFQFIINAFMGDQKKASSLTDTSTLKMNIDNIVINNTRIIYQDVITGDDMNLFITHLDAPIKRFDPVHLYFDIPTFTLTGLRGYYYQNEPLKPKIDSAIAEAILKPDNYLKIKNSEIFLKDIDVDYKSVPTNITTYLKLNKLIAHPETLDIKALKFTFKDISLDSSDIALQMGTKKKALVKKTAPDTKEVLSAFSISAKQINIMQSNFSLNNSAMPFTKYGMDYGHMDFKKINLTATDLLYNLDTTTAIIQKASLTEKSGFILNEFNADFLFTNTETSLKNVYIRTPGTVLRRDFAITYPSLKRLVQNPASLVLDLDIESSSVQVKDILTFAPALRILPAFTNSNQVWQLNGKVNGPLSNMYFNDLRFKGLSNTTFFVSGTLKGVPEPKKIIADVNFKYLKTGRKDILSLIPKESVPTAFTLPESISAVGRVKASMNDLVTDVTISTSLGSAKLKGSLVNYSNPKLAKYDYIVNTNRIDLGTIMKDKATYGILAGNFRIKGTGYDPNTANAKASGVINSITYNKYTYKNIKFDGSIARGAYTVNADVNDPNIDLSVVANGVFNGKYPSIRFTADIDSLKTRALHLTPQTVFFHGKIEGDLTNIDPDNLNGNILITNSVLVNNGERTQLDSVSLYADNSNGQQLIRIQSPFIFAEVQGKYKLTQLGDIIQQSIDPYFSLTGKKNTKAVSPYNFTINAKVFDNPSLRAFLPELKKIDSINIAASFSTLNGMNVSAYAPVIIYGTNQINDIKLNAVTRNNQIEYVSSFSQLKSGTFVLYATNLNGTIANNLINSSLNIKDAKGKNKYRFSGTLSQPSLDNYTFRLKPDSLMLNYEPWSVNADNSIQLLNGELVANQFVLNKGEQQLSINSIGSGTNRPVSIDFKNFNIATLAAFVQQDSLLVNGAVNGNILVKNYKVQPTFTSDLTINDLSIYKDTLGNVTAQVSNTTPNVFNANLILTGRGNDVNASGVYYLKPNNKSSFDFNVDIVKLQMKSLEGPSMGAIRNASGNLTGKISIKGTIDDPEMIGKINFENTAFNVGPLNNFFKINNESLTIDNNGFAFDNFAIKDSADNDLLIDGRINTVDFKSYAFDLKVNADNFQVINTTKKDNKIFYGKMVLTTALNIKGTNDQPVVDGSLIVNDKTNFTVVLPQAQPGVVDREGIVRFVDMDAIPEDSLFMLAYDSLNVSRLVGFDISTNITIDRNAELNLVLDEGNGDFINMKGEGLLSAGIDPSGKITLVGSYELDEGSYELSFNFLRRKFQIQKGSRILWTGEPTKADIDVSAVYIANASPIDLVQNQLKQDVRNTYRQKLPFEVWLTLKGELLKPAITFDIRLPEDKNYIVDKSIIEVVQNKLLQIREEPGEINKQVFALLLLSRFVNENPFDNSNGGLDAAEFARQSVSKLLTEQLNNLAGGLIAGVDINFELTTASDYTTGEKRNRTDFSVGLTKQLLGDRLTISVGSNFELEGPKPLNGKSNGSNIAGNVAIDYKISRDGRYVLRAYRKNEYEGVIEGYIVETGLSFIINVDYDHFKELLQRSKRSKSGKIPVTTPASDRTKIPDPVKPDKRGK
ncbi:MAG TPA: translocation/assembly module TamB domain-containing protein [Chitinophagaceae bacterium]|nr:translocation/assembly module TamB domain-containing protein [Chitinophagaceae bacterium]